MVQINACDIIYNIIFPIVIFLAMGGYYITVSAIYFVKMTILDGAKKNEYLEWKIFFLIEMIAGAVYIVISSIMIIIRFIFSKSKSKQKGVFAANVIINATQVIVFLATAVVAIAMMVVGQKNNKFGDWDEKWMVDSKIVAEMEQEYECQFKKPDTNTTNTNTTKKDIHIETKAPLASSGILSELPRKLRESRKLLKLKDIYVNEEEGERELKNAEKKDEKESCEDAFTSEMIGTIISHIAIDLAIAFSSTLLVIGGAKQAFTIIANAIQQNQNQNQNEEFAQNQNMACEMNFAG